MGLANIATPGASALASDLLASPSGPTAATCYGRAPDTRSFFLSWALACCLKSGCCQVCRKHNSSQVNLSWMQSR